MIKTAEKIEKYIREYDRIIVLGNKRSMNDNFLKIISQQIAEKKMLLVNGWEQEKLICAAVVQAITSEEYCNIVKLYHMYEFSDRIYIITDNEQYGCLGNYVSNELLTEEEAFMALLR